ncbi:hypothetical protein M441DRAFT_455160, partial [Trichoderma asperellum CBS 433.97]
FSHKENCQAGFAILDTKDFHQISPGEPKSTYFATGSLSNLSETSRKFFFFWQVSCNFSARYRKQY